MRIPEGRPDWKAEVAALFLLTLAAAAVAFGWAAYFVYHLGHH